VLMDRIRRGKNKHRGLLITVVVLIAAATVASFAVGGSSNIGKSTNNEDTTQVQIDALNTSIAESKKVADTDMTFSESKNLADMLIKVAGLQLDQNSSSTEAAQNALDAAKYYNLTIKKAPAELNDKGMADLIRQKATALYTAGDAAGAETGLKEALALVPLDYETNQTYIIYLLYSKGIDQAIAYAENYRAKLPSDDANIATVDSLISNLKSTKADQEKSSTNTSGTNSGQDSGTSAK